MPEPRWKYSEPTIMEEAASLTYATISWKFGEPTMMIYPTPSTTFIPTNLSTLMGMMRSY